MKVTRADLFWNYGATFMRVASALIVLPLILRMLPKEEVGLWTIMIGLNSMIYLLDFGFFQTFSRAITYIYSGASTLQKKGFVPVTGKTEIFYPLLKGTMKAMSRFYGFVSLLLLLLLSTGGVWYINRLLIGFSGDITNAKIAWFSYGVLLCYQFFTYYYDAALVGRGMIKRSRQIIVFSQSLHVVISSLLLLYGVGIISMVIGQTVATIVNRILARYSFYDSKTKLGLAKATSKKWFDILKTLFHTAYKNGLASLSWVFTNRMLAIFGALYVPLATMASYGITKQITDITITLSVAWFFTYYPKLTGEQIKRGVSEVKRIYIKATIITVAVFIPIAIFVSIAGNTLLSFIGSSTFLLPVSLIILLFVASMLEALTQISTSVLLSRNEVPHYIAQSVTAVVSLLFIILTLKYTELGVIALIAVPMVVQLCYQHWKWTLKLFKEFDIKPVDYLNGLKSIYKSLPIFSNNN
ncbi:MAG: O-unit flippase-like protein [Bacteroidales bacterium]|nr:O-unit flippase-like protein [Bacteroidales bacterium]